MESDDRGLARPRSGSIGFTAAIGAVAGVALAGHRGVKKAAIGAIAGAVALGTSEAIARARQRPNEIPPLWQRIASTTALAAPLGWAIGRFTRAGPVSVGIAAGTAAGALGLRPQKVAMGPLVGAAVGGASAAVPRDVPTSAVASATVLTYRVRRR